MTLSAEKRKQLAAWQLDMKKGFYITTTLPYVNAEPHIGFAMEITRADTIARYHRIMGDEVFFNTGTDEHGAKLWNDAIEAGKDIKDYVDMYAEKFRELSPLLNLSVDNFIRTTDPHHIIAAQEFWRRCQKNGFIYKKNYEGKYCVGCELEKTNSELENGRCPIHPNKEIEIISEENYFFKFSALESQLTELYEKNPKLVIPDFRFNEMRTFVKRGLNDFSISRLKSKMPWGVPAPDDDEHVMYVWFDALVSYISAIGWPDNETQFKKWWPVVQFAGKDQVRQQAAMWQAMLLSIGIEPSKNIIINGFINSGGQKMSKSLGNVISPFDVVDFFRNVTDFPEDVLRFVVLHDISSFEDGDITMDSIKESYKVNLQDGLGNLVSRVMKLAETYLSEPIEKPNIEGTLPFEHSQYLDRFEFNQYMRYVWEYIHLLDKRINETEPFKVVKTNLEEGRSIIKVLLQELYVIANSLSPVLPKTSEKIKKCIEENKMPEKPLFPRIEK